MVGLLHSLLLLALLLPGLFAGLILLLNGFLLSLPLLELLLRGLFAQRSLLLAGLLRALLLLALRLPGLFAQLLLLPGGLLLLLLQLALGLLPGLLERVRLGRIRFLLPPFSPRGTRLRLHGGRRVTRLAGGAFRPGRIVSRSRGGRFDLSGHARCGGGGVARTFGATSFTGRWGGGRNGRGSRAARLRRN